MKIIKNYADLGYTRERRDTLDIIESGLAAIDTKKAIEKAVSIKDDMMSINGHNFLLNNYRYIYIIGFGKVSCVAAQTLETVLAGRTREGAVIGIKEKVCGVVDTYAGTHPLPSGVNFTATKHIEEIAFKATAEDLVLVVVSGGGSALLCSGENECNQSIKLFEEFLPTGGTIDELNLVRKHISSLKGGGLAQLLYPAEVVTLVFSDIPGDDLTDVASGPTYFDPTTIDDARAVISKYNLGEYHLTETPKDKKFFERVTNIPLVTNETALEAMKETAVSIGYSAQIIDSALYADLDELQTIVQKYTEPGTVILIGGETKLKINRDVHGIGGRNDTVALSLHDVIGPNQLFASVASDGRDNTKGAGAIMDQSVKQKAKQSRLDPQTYLAECNAFPFFEALGGHIETGPLESNVSDLMLILNTKSNPVVVIDEVVAVVVKDSRGNDTISVTIKAGSETGTFAVPSGASTGAREVAVLPASHAVAIINSEIATALKGMFVCDQIEIDTLLHTLDGTVNFSRIGGNSALGVSVAVLKAAAAVSDLPTYEYVANLFAHRYQAAAPRLFVNLINGGKHAPYGSAIQEHQIIPETDDVLEALQAVRHVQNELHQILITTYGITEVKEGDEGGYVIPDIDPLASLSYLKQAIATSKTSFPISIGIDAAAGSFFTDDKYTIAEKNYSVAELQDWYENISTIIPTLKYIEDPFFEDDNLAFAELRQVLPQTTVIGDDLTTTNKDVLKQAIADQAVDALIIKPNQIGTISDTFLTMTLAYEHDIRCIVSHRSGETMDDFIADLAIGTHCFGLKAGAPSAPHRAVKYDRLRAILMK